MDRKGIDKKGPKQLCGPGKSRIPSFHRRESLRNEGAGRQAAARERLLSKGRNLDVGNHRLEEPGKPWDEEEERKLLLSRLEQFKAKKAKQRLEEMRSKTKPFVCGISKPSSFATPNKMNKSGRKSLTAGITMPFVTPTVKERPAEDADIHSKLPILRMQATKITTSFVSKLPTETDRSVTTPAAESHSKFEEAKFYLNDTYEVLPAGESKSDSKGLNGDFKEAETVANSKVKTDDKKADDAVQPCLNATVIYSQKKATEDNPLPPKKNTNFSVDKGSAWKPSATSSPFRENQSQPWYDGIEPVFRFNINEVVGLNNSPEIPSSRQADVEVFGKEDYGHGDGQIIRPAVSADGHVDVGEVVISNVREGKGDGVELGTNRGVQDYDTGDSPIRNGNGPENVLAMGDSELVIKNSVRRSNRSTRYTGSFKGQATTGTPRRTRVGADKQDSAQTKWNSTAKMDEITKRLVEIGRGEGILEVSPPASLVSAGRSPSSNITVDLASLNLSSTISKGSSSTWWKDSLDSNSDVISLTVSPAEGNRRFGQFLQRSLSDSDINTTSLSSISDSVFLGAPATPASILRTAKVAVSTQKKKVRFRTSSVRLSLSEDLNSTNNDACH